MMWKLRIGYSLISGTKIEIPMPCRLIELRSVKLRWIGSQLPNVMDVDRQDISSQIALTQIRKDKTLERVKQNLKENRAESSTHDTKGKEKENMLEHWIKKVATKRNPNLDPNPRTNRKMTKMSVYS